MSVPKRIKESLDSFVEKDYENALFQICCTIEPTAEFEYGKGGGANYKRFIGDNLLLITRTATGYLGIENLNIKYSHPDLKPDANGLVSVQATLYHVVRCGLYHKGKIPDDVIFDDSGTIGVESNVLKLPAKFIAGIAVAVITSPAYAGVKDEMSQVMTLKGLQIPLHSLWGKRTELVTLFETLKAFGV